MLRAFSVGRMYSFMQVQVLAIVVTVLLVSCSSSPRDDRPHHLARLDQQLVNVYEDANPFAEHELKLLLRDYELLDDAAGQWAANFKLANWYISLNKSRSALPYARRAEQLSRELHSQEYPISSYNNENLRFVSLIQLGQLSGEPSVLGLALNYAKVDVERLIALTYLKRFDEVEVHLNKIHADSEPSAAAFACYQLAKYGRDPEFAKKATDYYRVAGSHFGVVDSLFLNAQLLEESGGSEAEFIELAVRAKRAARHLPDEKRVMAIEAWIAAH